MGGSRRLLGARAVGMGTKKCVRKVLFVPHAVDIVERAPLEGGISHRLRFAVGASDQTACCGYSGPIQKWGVYAEFWARGA